ncbi:helix-turn-helix domain-containing protein [Saliterribacillus persicus]|uniref:AraC-like DNA-binding protein n=1 Tax=Saliterribacillus persicus TaxID=930114 RepID=A0A368XVH0_9BACI|nr:AraC family transcriptional regulator [Saliterribacillus persicus]RCW71953.1 AraC-like DNA-binding protein [Saliterribacillus persicus]
MHKIQLPTSGIPGIREIGYMGDSLGILKHPDRVFSNLHVFVYVEKGHIQVVEEDTSYQLSAGSYLFLKKNLHHWGDDYYEKGSKWYYIHFYDPQGAELPASHEYTSYLRTSLIAEETYHAEITLPKTGVVKQKSYVEAQLKKLLEEFETPHPLRPLFSSMHTFQFFLGLYAQQQDQESEQKSNRVIHRMIDLFHSHPIIKRTSEEIAEEIQMNYAYLSSLFKNHTGKSIMQYQNEILIEEAIQLFKDNNQNISEVSDLLGFSNPFYFSRVFKKVTGVSPSTYLQQIYRNV